MTLTPLPTPEQFFIQQYFEPVKREMQPFKPNNEETFEEAKARWEKENGYQCPINSFRTFERHYYGQ